MSLVYLIVFMLGSLQLIKEYREFNEFKRDEESFNEYKNIERWVAIKQYRTVKRIEDEGYEIVRKIGGGGVNA